MNTQKETTSKIEVIIVTKDGIIRVVDISEVSKIVANSADSFSIVKSSDGQKHQIDNFIVIKNGNNLELLFSNGETLAIENFYSYNNVELDFLDDSAHTLSSQTISGHELSNGTTLIYAQGSQQTLLSMAKGNESLELAISTEASVVHLQNTTDAVDTMSGVSKAALVVGGLLVAGGVAVAVNNRSDSDSYNYYNNNPTPTDTTLTGQLVDSAVAGVAYYINGDTNPAGYTDVNGYFSYQKGDTVTFQVGNVILKVNYDTDTIPSDKKVTLQDLVGVDRSNTADATVIKLAQFLQTLDADGNADNGIQIVANADGKIIATDYDDIDTNKDGIVDAVEFTAAQEALKNSTKILINEDKAKVGTDITKETDVSELFVNSVVVKTEDEVKVHLDKQLEIINSGVKPPKGDDVPEVVTPPKGDVVPDIETPPNIPTPSGGGSTPSTPPVVKNFSGSVPELLTALDGLVNQKGSITITGHSAATLAELKTMNDKTTGIITLNEATKLADFSGTSADVLAALDGVVGYKGNLTITDALSISQIGSLDAVTTETLSYNTIKDSVQNLTKLSSVDYIKDGVGIVVSDAVSVYEISQIATMTSGTLTYSKIKDSVEMAMLEISLFTADQDFEMIGEDAATLEELKTINDVTEGTITLNSATKMADFSGTATDLVAALDKIVGYEGNITIADTYAISLAQLKSINDATTGSITLNAATQSADFSATAEEILAAFDGITSLTGNITVTDALTIAQLASIDATTSGAKTYTKIKDTVENITDNLELFTNNQDFEMIGEIASTLQELKAINDKTSGEITLNDATNEAGFSGSAVELATALDGSSGLTQKMTITGDDAATLAQLKTINDATTGVVVLNAATKIAPFAGSLTDLQAALDAVEGYSGNITITGSQAIPITQLESLPTLTTGAVTYSAEAIAAGYSGSASELVTALAKETAFTQKLTITGEDAATLEQLITINNKSSEEIILSGATKTAPYSGSIDDILAALDGVKEYSAEITITGESVVTLAQIKLLNLATSGTSILNDATKNAGFSGSVEDLLLVLDGVSGLSQNITITGETAATLEQLKLINEKTTGTITINEATKTADFSGTAADLLTALDTVVGYTGTITATGGASIEQINSLKEATTSNVIYDKIIDTAQNAADNLALFSSNQALEMVGETAATLEQLKAINNVTDGTLTLNAITKTTPFSGSAADLAAALKEISGYVGDVTITGEDAATLSELKAINTETTGTFTLNSATNESAYTASSADLLLAFDGITSSTGALTVSTTVTATDLNTIAGITTGVLKANLADTTLTAGVVDLFDNLTKADVITLYSGKVNATILLALNEKTSLVTSNIWQITELATTTDVVQVVTDALALQPNVMVEITDGALSATQINALDAATTAKVMASYEAPDLTTLLSLTNVNNNNSINISVGADNSFKNLTAANLIAIDSFSRNSVDYRTSTTKITGSIEELAYVAQLSFSPRKLFLSEQVEIITTGTQAEASYLNAINSLSREDINALSVTKISGEYYDFIWMKEGTDRVGGGITLTTNVGIHITDGAAISDLGDVLALKSQFTTTGSFTYTIKDTAANVRDAANSSHLKAGISVILKGDITAADITAIKNTGVTLTYNWIDDTIENAVANIAMFDNNQEFYMTGTTVATLAQLKTINNATEGDIELNEATLTANFTGTAADLAAAFYDINDFEGTLTVTDTPTLKELVVLFDVAENLTFNVSITSTPHTGTGVDLLDVVPNIAGYTGKITLTPDVDDGSKSLYANEILELSEVGEVFFGDITGATLKGNINDLTMLMQSPNVEIASLGNVDVVINYESKYVTQTTLNDLKDLTAGTIDLENTMGIELEGLSLDLSGFSQLSNLNGKTINIKGNDSVDSLSLTAEHLFAASDKVGNLSFTVRGDANDTLNLSGWIKNANTNYYSTTGNFDGVAGDETYTVNVIDAAVVIA